MNDFKIDLTYNAGKLKYNDNWTGVNQGNRILLKRSERF